MGSGLQYKYGGKTRVLEDTSLRALASFARHVDRTPATRNAIAQADELSAVVQIAHSLGFSTVSEEVLVKACLGMTSLALARVLSMGVLLIPCCQANQSSPAPCPRAFLHASKRAMVSEMALACR